MAFGQDKKKPRPKVGESEFGGVGGIFTPEIKGNPMDPQREKILRNRRSNPADGQSDGSERDDYII